MNKKYIWITLGIFLVLGLYLRLNMVNFPDLGYHNMKSSTENIAEAKLMLSNPSSCLLHRCSYFFNGGEPGEFGENGSSWFEEYTQLPILPWLTAIGWTLMGNEPIWYPRLIIIMFSLMTILVMYFMTKRLTDDDYLALLSSCLITIMPLGIYFGRNFQQDMPALFFSILSIYFYLGWIKSFNKRDLFLATLSLGTAALFKETFLIVAIPLLCITPWKRLYYAKFGESFPIIGWGLLGCVPFVALQEWYSFITYNKDKIVSEAFSLSAGRIINWQYWINTIPSLRSYIADNFTFYFFIFALIGIVLACIKFKSLIGRLTIGYLISLIPYCALLSGKIGQHSYYQMPYLPLVCILSAYFLYSLGNILEQVIKIKYIKFIPLVLIIIAIPSMIAANDRVFGTVFFGQEVAGEYIKIHTIPTDRFFIYGHSQEFSVCTYAERRCAQPGNDTKGNIWNLETTFNGTMPDIEQEFNARYIVMSMYGYSIAQQFSNWQYIQDNYKIVWAGFLNVNGQLTPQNFILEKGGKFNLSDLQGKQPYLATTYKMSFGDIPYYVIE